MTKFNIPGKGQVNLSKKDFIAQGGEGAVYAHGKTAYKIYCDSDGKPQPDKMIDVGKIQELSVLTHPNIIKPEDIILSGKVPIGYSMKYVTNTYQLCQLFTKAFKTRNNLKPENMMELVLKLQDIVSHAHKHNILIVDLNEMNFLVDDNLKDIYAIDVDSWQTPNHHATAIMESIRDRQVTGNKFTTGSDWYSFGIISFQMLVGIHPYKGKHQTVKTLDERMIKNISVLNPDVNVPKVCMPFSVIPKPYFNWYKAVLEDGKRLAPPNNPNELIVVFVPTIKKVAGTNNFDITELYEYDDNIVLVAFALNKCVTVTDNATFINKRKVVDRQAQKQFIAHTPTSCKPILSWIDDDQIHVYNLDGKTELNFTANAEQLMVCDGRLYTKYLTGLNEIIFKEIGGQVYIIQKRVANVMNNACKLFDSVAMQNVMGTFHAVICPETGNSYQIKINELYKQRVIDAKYMNNVLMIVSEKSGKYNRHILRFNEDFTGYDIRIIKDIDYSGLNFVVTSKGICVSITEDETIEVFANKKDSAGVKVVDDATISGDMKLTCDGNKVYFSKDKKIYRFTMK